MDCRKSLPPEKSITETAHLIQTSGKASSDLSSRRFPSRTRPKTWRLSLFLLILPVCLFSGDIVRYFLVSNGQEVRRIESPVAGFENPSNAFRPRFRYWVPDAHVSTSRVEQDITEAGARGAAGVEVLGFYQYGAAAGEYVPVDWNVYGWGTPAWSKKVPSVSVSALSRLTKTTRESVRCCDPSPHRQRPADGLCGWAQPRSRGAC